MSADDPFINFCKERSLVLVGQLARWREENPSATFEEMLLRNHTQIQEDNWLDAVAGAGVFAPIVTLPDMPRLPLLASSGVSARLRAMFPAIILQDDPIMVVATYNPFIVEKISDGMGVLFPARAKRIVLVTPHAFSRAAALIERGACTFTGDWGEDISTWCALLGQSESGYLDLGMVIEDIWRNSEPTAPVMLPGQFTGGETTKGIDAIIVRKTALNAWALTNRPLSKELHDVVMQKLGRRIHFMAVGPNEFKRLFNASEQAKIDIKDIKRESALQVRDWGLAGIDDVTAALRIVQAAIAMGASDIHMEPKTNRARVRFRVDNELFEQAPLPLVIYQDVLKRLKIMGSMMQDKRGIIQDGAGDVDYNGVRYDLRFSILIVNGGDEAVVVRIFNSKIPDLADLRLNETEMKVLKWFLDQENGMCVCSGPTGSGKTTLLYALLNALDSPDIDLVTIEQPVEKHFENAKQINVKEDGHMTYKSALRSVLRQDPDVIMIGEIRDDESAVKGVEAAQTGHLVITTTHANSAVGVIQRLCGAFPVDPVSLGSVLKLSIAQRLVGRLCSFCKKVRQPRASDLEYFPPTEVAKPIIAERNGCSVCRGTGLAGRILIMEMMPIDDVIREMIAAKRAPSEIELYNRRRGFTGLIEQASYLLQTGEISLESARQFVTRPLI